MSGILLKNEMGSGREEICVRGSLGCKGGETEMRKVRRGISLPKVSGDKERGGSYLFHNLKGQLQGHTALLPAFAALLTRGEHH